MFLCRHGPVGETVGAVGVGREERGGRTLEGGIVGTGQGQEALLFCVRGKARMFAEGEGREITIPTRKTGRTPVDLVVVV